MKLPASCALAVLLLSASPLLCAEEAPAAPVPANAIDALTADELDEVLALLREHYLAPAALDDLEINRATIQGLLSRLGSGAAILATDAAAKVVESPFRSEILDQRIGYARLGAVTDEHLARLDGALDGFVAKNAGSVILDLRATPPGSDYERAAEVCRRFTPKGKVLFSVKKPRIDEERVLTSKDDPKYRGLLVVLVDHDSAGSAEVIAAVLRTQARAMVIGQRTKGQAVEYADLPLPGGKVLHTAVAEVVLADAAPVFPGGLSPDLNVEVAQETTDAVLAGALEKGVGDYVFEVERAKMNEAALVAGTNPEIEAIQAAQRKGAKAKPMLRDVVLQRAVDFITTLALSEKKPPGE